VGGRRGGGGTGSAGASGGAWRVGEKMRQWMRPKLQEGAHMSDVVRLTDRSRVPTDAEVVQFVGARNAARWAELARFIAAAYPRTFTPEWLFGGQKHGWTLRYKTSKSFCTFVPERGRFKVLLVFGAAEREKVEQVLPELASHVREDYANSHTYHDGRWVLVTVGSAQVVADIERLLAIKRRPKSHLPVQAPPAPRRLHAGWR
jgi:hypothetical protein